MKRIPQLLKLVVLLFVVALIGCQPQAKKKTEKKVGKHYVWMGEGKDHGAQELEKMFIRLKETGFDGIMYQCALEKYPAAIELAHKHGLELHAWQTIMRHYNDSLLTHHEDWYTISRDGKSTATHPPYVDYYKWLCPTKQPVRDYLVNFVQDIAVIPNIDGVHLDYIRHSDVILPIELWEKYDLVMDKEYPEFDFCYCDDCIQRFQTEQGIDAGTLGDQAPDNKEWRKFRYDMVTEVVDLLTKAVHEKETKITAAVFPTPTIASTLVRQEWNQWHLDAYYPMNYNSFYEEEATWVEGACAEGTQALNGKAPLYSGLFVPALNPQDLRTAIQGSKKGGAAGICVFTPYDLKDEHWKVLQEEITAWK